jgi:hypothetical protein
MKEEILCNKCGNSCCNIPKELDYISNSGMIDCKVYGGYFSEKLEDFATYTFSLCENCICELFNQFKIPVRKTETILC